MTFFRVTLHSGHALSGDYKDGTYFVDLPQVVEGEHMLAVESFQLSAPPNQPLILASPTLSQGNSYSTLTNGPGFHLLTVPPSGAYCERVTTDSLGFQLRGLADLRAKQLRIQLLDLAGNALPADAPGATWVMTLVVWPTPKSPALKEKER